MLIAAQESMSEQLADGKISPEQYRDFEREIESTRQQLTRLEAAASGTDDAVADVGDAAREAGDKAEKASGGWSVLKGTLADLAASAIKTAASAIGDTAKEMITGAAEYGDTIDKMSQKMGMSSDAYQEWDFVLQHCGASIESLKPAMKTLATAAESGSDAFAQLGISQEQIAGMSQEQLFDATIAGLQNVTDETQRTYLAGKLLGRGATELGPLLNTSADDVADMRAQVHDLGGVMGSDAVKAAAAYADGAVYLDCLTSYDHRCSQTVELRKNLLGLTDEIDGADLVTRVYPVGKDGLTIEDVNGGQVYLVNAAAEGIYGRIDGTLQADTDDASALKATAASYLAQHSGLSRGIQVTAADLSAQDIMIEAFAIGDSVRVVSPPHGIDTIMQVSKLDTSLVGSKSSMTIGWGKKSLTGSVSSSGSRSTSTSPGGSSSADTIIDQGTTGKWTWRKWASGVAEMWAKFDAPSLTMTSQTWGPLYTASWMGLAANKAARQYPFAFVENPVVSATPTVGSGNIWLATNTENDIGTRLTHAPAYQCVRASDATVNSPQISYYVVGRYR